MTIKEELLRDFSKPQMIFLANKIGANQESFDELIDLFLHEEVKVTQRAAWLLSHCVDRHPWLMDKHIKAVILNLNNDVNDAVKRNTLRVLQFKEIPEELMGILAGHCFNYLNSGKEPIAIKAHSMTILFNIVKVFPELKEELQISIEDQIPFGSAGIKGRGTKILKALRKIN